MTPEQEAQYEAHKARIDAAAAALNATKWWQFTKRSEAADAYRDALLLGSLWELENGLVEPRIRRVP